MARKRGSEIWNFMEEGVGGDTAMCLVCKCQFKYSKGSTSNLLKHVRTKHQLQFEGNFLEPSTSREPVTVETAARAMTQPTLAFAVDRNKLYPRDSARKRELDQLVLRMVTRDLQPISVVENEGFRDLMKSMNPRYKLPNRKKLGNELLVARYKEVKALLKAELFTATDVCVTTDMTSRQTSRYITVTAHYILPSWELRSAVLATTRMTDDHTASNIASTLKETFDDWGIADKIVAVVTDNAANMVSAVNDFLKARHLPCFAHTLNLVVKDALKRNGEIQNVLTRVKAIVRYFHTSVEAVDRLKDMQQKKKQLINDVETRWTSTIQMLRRYIGLHKEVTAVLVMLSKGHMCVSGMDVEKMKSTVEALEPFELATEEMSAEKRTTLSKVIPILAQLQECLCEMCDSNTLAQELGTQMQKRFRLLQASFPLAASTFLDPRFKQLPFTDEDALEKAEGRLTSMLFAEFVADPKDNPTTSTSTQEVEDESGEPPRKKTLWGNFDKKVDTLLTCTPRASTGPHLEMRRYVESQQLRREEDPLTWWKINEPLFPKLATIAKKFLCITATSVSSERFISKAGELMSERRSSLKDSTVDMILFLNKNDKKPSATL